MGECQEINDASPRNYSTWLSPADFLLQGADVLETGVRDKMLNIYSAEDSIMLSEIT